MRISMKADYGIRAMVDLARHYGQGPVQTSEIAARQFIPEPYLDQLLTVLRKAGLIRSIRGPQGGHMLMRPPSQITMGEVITALEGNISVLDCLDDMGTCQLSERCGQRSIWQEIRTMTRRILESVTIQDLLEREEQAEARVMYHI